MMKIHAKLLTSKFMLVRVSEIKIPSFCRYGWTVNPMMTVAMVPAIKCSKKMKYVLKLPLFALKRR